MNVNKAKNTAKKIFTSTVNTAGKILSNVTVSVGTVIIIALLVYLFRNRIHDIIFPPEENIVSVYTIEESLEGIGKLVTAEYSYSGWTEETNSRKFPLIGANIPLTENKITVSFQGSIKAGYNFDKIKISVVNFNKTIYVSLPDPEIISNEIEVTEYRENNNILNPLSGNASYELLDVVKVGKEEEAISEKGLYDKADTTAKEIITDKLGSFSGFKVVIL